MDLVSLAGCSSAGSGNTGLQPRGRLVRSRSFVAATLHCLHFFDVFQASFVWLLRLFSILSWMEGWREHLFLSLTCRLYRVWGVAVRATTYKERRNAIVGNRLNLNVREMLLFDKPFRSSCRDFWISELWKFLVWWWINEWLFCVAACQKIVGTRLSASSQCLSGGSRPVTPQPLVNSPSHNHSTFLYKVCNCFTITS